MSDTEDPASADAERLRALRELLPATSAGIYLDTATLGPMSAETAAAMREADDWELRVGRAWDGRDDDVVQRYDEARAVLAALVGADPMSITIAPGRAAAAGIVQRALGVGPERILHHVDPATGARLALPAPGSGPHVADATLSAGALPIAVDALGVDGLIFATDRWLLGPENTAAVWLREPLQEASGSPPSLGRTQLIGLARSVGWLEMFVGLEWLLERGVRLAHRLRSRLAAADGVEVLTPAANVAALVVFRLPAWPGDEALVELRRRVFAIVSQAPGSEAIRASVAWFNTEDEIDRFADAVAELGRHTPQTLPRRPTLVVH